MKVLVLGGTGAMGVHLVQLLSNDGIETVVTTRKSRKSESNVKYIQGNAHNIEFLQTILQEHWDAIVDFMVYTTVSFRERIDLLLNATTQYVFLSSARVYADSERPIIETSSRLLDVSQDADYLATDEYALTKARQEAILIKSGYKNYTIIRPYITYSKNRLQLGVLEKEEWLYGALHDRTIVFSSDIMTKTTTLTSGFDVAKGIVSIIGKRNALREVFHITTAESIKWSKVLEIYLAVLEKHLRYKPKVLLQDLDKFLEWKGSKYQIIYDRLFDRKFDNSKVSEFVDVANFIDIETGLQQCLESFLENPEFNYVNWKMEIMKSRLTSEKIPLSEVRGIKNKIRFLIFKVLY
ncbi:MAG: NAD-dependent epimerase/dehydratase family protein [Bacteroidales bacterium]|jgi:nucleoside-diphosphate-sugar epimerase|nr:NAD-dependent epimerase/dehydratase family protein [Bacteroidales bacterium]